VLSRSVPGNAADSRGAKVQAALNNNLQYPELYREGLSLLHMLNELNALAKASLVADVRLEDLTSPSSGRLQRLLSAVLNFGRFQEGVMTEHKIQTEALDKLHEQLKTTTLHVGELVANIKEARERMQKELPERAELENAIKKEEDALHVFENQRQKIEQGAPCLPNAHSHTHTPRRLGVDEDRKLTDEERRAIDTLSFDVVNARNAIDDLKSQLVSSPERIQAELTEQRRALDLQREEHDGFLGEERELAAKAAEVRKTTKESDAVLNVLADVETEADKALKNEEDLAARKARIESSAFQKRDLLQRDVRLPPPPHLATRED